MAATPPAVRAQTAFVANQLSDDVSVVDARTHTAVDAVSAGPRPAAVLASPIGRFTYVAAADPSDAGAGVVAVLDATSLEPLGEVPVGGSPRAMAASTDGRRLFVVTSGAPGSDDGLLVIIDAEAAWQGAGADAIVASPVIGGEPGGIAVDPSGRFVYVTNAVFSPGNVVFVVDLALALGDPQEAVVAAIDVGNMPLGIAATADGRRAYVANFAFGSNQVTLVDLEKRQFLRNIKVGSRPAAVALSPDGRFAFVSNLISNSVSVIDCSTNKVKATVDVGHAPQGLAFTPDGAFLYVANRQSLSIATQGDVSVIDAALAVSAPRQAVITSVDVGNNPLAVAVAPEPLPALTRALFSPLSYADADVNQDQLLGAADVLSLLRNTAAGGGRDRRG